MEKHDPLEGYRLRDFRLSDWAMVGIWAAVFAALIYTICRWG